MNLDNVTAVCVTGVYHIKSMESLITCSNMIQFASSLFISDHIPDNYDNSISYVKIDPITSKDSYSKFMLYDLHKYIKTPYCLVIQHDGYVVNPTMWSSDFLEYDYIGAPWPIKECYVNQFGEQCRVGNGGFSLRSKRLLEMPYKLNIPFEIGKWNNEDLNICVFNRHLYLDAGITIAPIETAVRFSHELYVPEMGGIVPFGQHGKPLK